MGGAQQVAGWPEPPGRLPAAKTLGVRLAGGAHTQQRQPMAAAKSIRQAHSN